MGVVVPRLHRRVEPADELAPAEPPAGVAAVAVAEPRRGEHRGAVVVEDVDLVIVEGDDDLELRVVVEIADADVLAVGAVAVVAGAVEVGVVALAAQLVVARPRRRRGALGPVERALRAEDEHLRSRRGGVRRRHDDLGPAVSVEVGRGQPSCLRALAAAARRCGPARLDTQPAAAQLVRGHRPLVAADDDLRPPVSVEVGHGAGGVDPPLRRRALAEQAALRVEDERRVEGCDELELAVAVQVDEPGRGEPARLAGLDVPDEAGRRDGSRCRVPGAAGRGTAAVGGAGAVACRRCNGDQDEGDSSRQAARQLPAWPARGRGPHLTNHPEVAGGVQSCARCAARHGSPIIHV